MKKLLLSLLASLAVSSSVAADLEFTVMHGPGGVSDIVTRYIAKEVNRNYNVVNRPGAAGKIAIGHLMSEKTIILATMPQVFVTNPLNFNDLNYNPQTDLEVLATIGVMPSALLCNTKTGFETFKDFQETSKTVTFGVGGYGSSEHVSTEVLIKKVKLSNTIVPYAQGGNKSVTDLLGGHIDCMFGNFPTVRAFVDHPNVRVLLTSHNMGVKASTWEKEFKETFPLQNYLSVVAPASMDTALKKAIADEFNTAFKKPTFSQGLQDLGVFPRPSINKLEIQKSIKVNDAIRKFIIDNNIKISQ